jgi:hypothetical protein
VWRNWPGQIGIGFAIGVEPAQNDETASEVSAIMFVHIPQLGMV